MTWLDTQVELWNNPSCSKCAAARETLASLQVGPVHLRPYLEEPPTVAELTSVLERLRAEPWDICRLGEPVAAELGLSTWPREATSRQDWIEVMAAHPILIQRPILLFDDGTAMVARDAAALEASLKE